MPVTDADMERAATFLESWEPGPEMTVVKLGREFAAHREAAERAGAQAGLEAAAKVAFDTLHPTNPEDGWTVYTWHNARNARLVAKAIRAIDPASLCQQTDQESGT